MSTRFLPRSPVPLLVIFLLSAAASAQQAPAPLAKPSIVHKVQPGGDRLEMTVHTSRILTMDQKIPQAQVNNPEVLELTPLSPDQIQVAAKAAGVTQINLWGEDQKVYTVDVIVYPDVQQLEMVLRTAFPRAALKITPVANSVMISGFVDQEQHIARIIRIAEEYYPKVINNMTVGGTQQVLLHVKILEVSRTKLRQLGFDFSKITGSNVITSTPGGTLANTFNSTPVTPPTPPTPPTPWSPVIVNGSAGTFSFGIANGTSAFLGVLDALRQDDLAKLLAEPTLTTVSGRPAHFLAGGSFYIVPQGLAASQPIQVNYGTQLDFIPIVLGNGRIHLDVRPKVSEIDPSLSVQGYPGLLQREAETGLEIEAGQTLAIAGLVQSRVEAENLGLPWVSEVPYLGVLFRRVKEQINEVELLILVTPELVEAMDPGEVPPCGPGTQTTSPNDWELLMKGHLEVPKCCPAGNPHGPPPDGMMLGPGEPIPPPQPADAAGRATGAGPAKTGESAPRQPGAAGDAGTSYNRYTPSKPNASSAAAPAGTTNGPPGLIGPIGYDVVK